MRGFLRGGDVATWQHSVDITSAVLANAVYLSANHAIAASETSTMANEDRPTEREIRIARVLRPLGTKPMTRSQAVMAGKLLGLHWTSVYRLRRRFLGDPVASAMAPK